LYQLPCHFLCKRVRDELRIAARNKVEIEINLSEFRTFESDCFSCHEQVNETLKELHLLKHVIRDFGATRLAEELQHNFTLTYLALSWYLSQFLNHTPFSL